MRIRKSLIFIFLLFVFSLTSVYAAKIWEEQGFQSSFNSAKNNYLGALSTYRSAREQYLEALNKFKALECKEENQKCKEQKDKLVDKAKQYLLKIKDAMAKYLTIIKTKIENIKGINEEEKSKIVEEITKDLEWLDTRETEIRNIQTADQVKEMNQSLRTFWIEEQTKVKKYIGSIMVWKLEEVTERMEAVTNKIQEKIDELDKEEFDVSEIQKSLNEIKDKLKQVKDKTSEAETLFNESKFEAGKEKVKETAKILKDIHSDLKSFVGEINKNKLKKREVSGEGKIMIKGEGFVSLTGNGTISGKVGNENFTGTVTILDKGKDSQIETYGKGEKIEMGDGRVQYKGVEKIQIKGSDIIVEISSGFIDINAEGEGTVVMKGDGLYKAKGAEWTDIPSTEIKIDL